MTRLLTPFRRGVWRYLSDRDILHAGFVTILAVVASCGLVYVGYLAHVWHLAARSPLVPPRRMVILVFGRRLVADEPEADYRARLGRGLDNASAGNAEQVLLLGGLSGGVVSEAEAGQRWLLAQGWPGNVPLELEQASIDSLENLRHARSMLRDQVDAGGALPAVALVTSRYHLARCLLLARRLGFDATPVAAEPRLPRSLRYVVRIAAEAGYIMWTDIGLRWAVLIGNRRMVERIS
ncbi:YdcF family protein [Luteibacter rhizovicinus]|nr:YdcF family protein [Luteibacter rhizovicinus]